MSKTFNSNLRRIGHIKQRRLIYLFNKKYNSFLTSEEIKEYNLLSETTYIRIERHGCNRRYYAARKVLARRSERKKFNKETRKIIFENFE